MASGALVLSRVAVVAVIPLSERAAPGRARGQLRLRRPRGLVLSLLAALSLFGCAASPRPSVPRSAQQPLQVMASVLPVTLFTRAVASGCAQVESLVPVNLSPHDWQATPADLARLSQADVLVINGLGLESQLDKLVEASGNTRLRRIDTSRGVAPITEPSQAAHADHASDHGPLNPHIWLDPVIAKKQAANIVAALQKADPANASAYAQKGKVYEAKLSALDSDYRSTLAPLPNKNLVTFHDAFPYLAARYKLNYVGAISEFPEKDPTPKQLAALVDKIRNLKVGVLFAENGYAPGLLKKIASETGAKVSELDTLEVGQGTPTAYLDRMGANLESLRKAFGKGD